MARRIRCGRCRNEAELVHDEPGVAVQLSHEWRRVGNRRDGSSVFLCPSCVDGLMRFLADNESVEQSR